MPGIGSRVEFAIHLDITNSSVFGRTAHAVRQGEGKRTKERGRELKTKDVVVIPHIEVDCKDARCFACKVAAEVELDKEKIICECGETEQVLKASSWH